MPARPYLLFVSPLPALLGLGAALLGACTAVLATPYMGLATFSYFLMVAGIACRRGSRQAHRAFMLSAVTIDLSLVLALEWQRGATATAAAFTLSPWQTAHVAASTLAVIFYVPLLWAGFRLWQNEAPSLRRRHRVLGFTAFVLRTLGFLLMFSLLGRELP